MAEDPGLIGPSGQPLNAGAEILLSKFENISKELAKGAAKGEEAYKAAFEDIRRDLELHMMPAFYKLSQMDLVKPSQIAAVIKGFNEAEKVVTKYHQIAGSQAERHAEKTRNTLKGQLTDIEKYYAQLKAAAQDAAKTEEEKHAVTRKIDQEAKDALAKHTKEFRAEEAKGLGTQGGKALLGLAGIGSLAAVAQMIAGVSTNLFNLGAAVARTRGEYSTGVGGFTGIGGQAAATALGGMITPGAGGISPSQQAEMLGIVYSRAPQLAGENLVPMIERLTRLGITTTEQANLLGQASEESGIKIEGMVANLEASRKIAGKFGSGVMETMKQVMDFSKVLRGTGVDATTAGQQAQAWTFLVQDVGNKMHLGRAEIGDFAGKFQNAIASMSPSHAAGLLLATTGKMPTSLSAMGQQVGTVDFAQSVYSMISKGAGAQGQMFVPEAFGKLLGMGNMNIQTARLVQEAMTGGRTTMEQLQQKGFQSQEANIQDARNALVHMDGPLRALEKGMQLIVEYFLPGILTGVDDLAHSKFDLSTLRGFFQQNYTPQKGVGRLTEGQRAQQLREDIDTMNRSMLGKG